MRGSFFVERHLVDAKKFEEASLAALIVVFESCILKSCRIQDVSSLLWSSSKPPPSRCLGSCGHHSSSHEWEFTEPVCCEI